MFSSIGSYRVENACAVLNFIGKRRASSSTVFVERRPREWAQKPMCYEEGMTIANELKRISDDDLLRRLLDLLKQSRRVESELVAHIGEVDERRLYAREAASSMFTYATEVLHLSEHEAYLRINAARAARRYPMILTMLADGRLHLSGIAKLAAHLTDANCAEVLTRAAHRSKREIEELVAELAPKPDVPPTVRKLPMRTETTPVAELGPDRVARKNIAESRDFMQKDLDTLSRTHADLHATPAQIHLHIDEEAIGACRIHENAKRSIA